jgi:PilZ domain
MLQHSKSPIVPLPRFGSAEDRREERRRVLLQAKILVGREVIWCAVRDISNSGAKLEIGEDVRLPPEFDLVIGKRDEIVRARLRWREGCFAGVSLTSL